jgi:transcriptional regulator with XRE-family HTH domain
MSVPNREGHGPDIGEILRNYRLSQTPRMTQVQLAERLSVDQSHISRIERGEHRVRSIDFLWRIVRRLDIDPRRLGISPELQSAIEPERYEKAYQAAVRASHQEWLAVRQYLNHHRADLARLASALYPDALHLGSTLITLPKWLPKSPVNLLAIDLGWVAERVSYEIHGTEPEALRNSPLRSPGHQYERYTLAIRGLSPPVLFENRPSYRLMGIDWSPGAPRLIFGLATYFDKLDVCEATGHELATAARRRGADRPSWADLPFRALIGDPFDLGCRAVLPAVTTLTLRRDAARGTATFLLHWRESDKVATAGGLFDAIPAGEFQPSSLSPWDQANDFDLWRNIVREFSEELLGNPEHDGSSSEPIDYDGWPLFRALAEAERQGKLRAYCFGVGLDALTLAATILTAVVIDDDVFDEVFRYLVLRNSEGHLAMVGRDREWAAEGVPFVGSAVTDLVTNKPMASPGAACLDLAWRHRDLLLGDRR